LKAVSFGVSFDAHNCVFDFDKRATELRAKRANIVDWLINRIYRMRELLDTGVQLP
jgi:hypothetical protein